MKRLLSICPHEWDREALASFADTWTVETIGEKLVEKPTLFGWLKFDPEKLLREIRRRHEKTPFDAVIGTGDHPGALMAALAAESLRLPGPKPETIVRLSHKLTSREIQRRAAPEATPRFEAIDPQKPATGLPPPIFVKPVRGTMSIGARRVDQLANLSHALHLDTRTKLTGWIAFRPFDKIIRRLVPEALPPKYFVAETLLKGAQVTVDGFVDRGKVTIMGVVDSVLFPGTISFKRFDYPSQLPARVQIEMGEIASRIIAASGLDATCFNVELFYDSETDTISVIEVNPRMSYQFADLYQKVDGLSSYAVQLALATRQQVNFPKRQGRHRAATSFVLRRFEDAKVRKIPEAASIAAVKNEAPDAVVRVLCRPGQKLSWLPQDVGSFRYGIVNLGGAGRDELDAQFTRLEQNLGFELEPV